jgi:hypothetical protein
MPYAQKMTHADRAQRRKQIKAMLREGKSPLEVAKHFGLTKRYICQIAQDAGLSRAKGRPKGSRWWADCPPHLIADYDYLTRRLRIPVAEVKIMLEAA